MQISQKGFENFIELCGAKLSQKELSALFDLFLTPEEKENLGLRYMIVQELLAGEKTQREIAKDLNVSIAKITRGSNELKRLNPNIVKLLKKSLLPTRWRK